MRNPFDDSASPATRKSRWLKRLELFGLIIGLCAVTSHMGQHQLADWHLTSLGGIILASMSWLTASILWRCRLARNPWIFLEEQRVTLLVYGVWLLGVLLAPLWSQSWEVGDSFAERMGQGLLHWSEFWLLVRFGLGVSETARDVYQLGWNPAVILVLSFVLLIALGTFLLWLPSSRRPNAIAPEHISPLIAALYTSTSACCVTGLVVVNTREYWSPSGQFIIMCLIQLGGLGILTFGGFAALISGRQMQVGEGALLRDLFEADQVAKVKRMVISILVFTFGSELIGAVLLWGVWPELPFGERVFYCAFHAIAGFCNAGFSLQPLNSNFFGYGLYWQVWGVIAGLVILGGLGFGTLYESVKYIRIKCANLLRRDYLRSHRERARLSISSRLALWMTALLLVGGTIGLWVLDQSGSIGKLSFWEGVSGAWFQSVVARTAGFNTIDIGGMTPAAKFLLIILMFIGASPVSTGGGVKTVSFAVILLALRSILIGRDRVEIWGRTIPEATVKRASAIFGSALMVVIVATLLITVFENRAALFLDHLFEATSAFGTVGLSTGISPQMTIPSLLTVVVTMFIGRVGPLTLFVAIAGREAAGRYQYPEERITLG